MTRNRSRRQGRLSDVISPVLRPLLWSTVLGAAVAFAFATPVYADPASPDTIPNIGARPAPIGAVQLPGQVPPAGAPTGTVLPPNLAAGPLAAQLAAMETEVATLGDQLLGLRQERDAATAAATAAKAELDMANARLAEAEKAGGDAASEALKEAAALPPGEFGSDLHGLGVLSRIQRGEHNGTDLTAQNRAVALAQAAVQEATRKFTDATNRVTTTTAGFDQKSATYKEREAALLALRKKNAAQLLQLERERDAAEQRLGASFTGSDSIAGMAADPRALAAVRYALAQLGDPYLWGAEGPDRFDCSGLMWAAYRSPGAGNYRLPRVAKDQYYATRDHEVAPSALLPGDLIFFSSGPEWTSVHHVGMYIGGGQMVHAPTTGDVVKISPVWWSRYFRATRVYGAVPAPEQPSQSKPTPPKPKPPKPTPPASTPPHRQPPTPRPPIKPTPKPSPPPPAPTGTTTTPPTNSSSPSSDPSGITPSAQPSGSGTASGGTTGSPASGTAPSGA